MRGYLFDRPDGRDEAFRLGSSSAFRLGDSAALPKSYSLAVEYVNPRDQVGESCVGFSTSVALRVAYIRQLGKDPGEFSAFDAYYKSRAVWGGQDKDQGTYLRTTFRALQLLGCALERKWPSTDIRGINKAPSWSAQKSAHRYRGIRGYYPIPVGTPQTLTLVKLALSHKLPVVGGWHIGSEFRNYDGRGAIGPAADPDAGHAYWIEAFYEDGTFGIFNSVVKIGAHRTWGRDGRATVTPEHVQSAHVLWAVAVEDKHA